MSKCDLYIYFEDQKRTFAIGDIVRGKVSVIVNKDVKCNGLLLSAFYKAHGKGNTEQREYISMSLFEGDWRVGQQLEFPFEFEIQNSPPTYRGEYLNIEHHVRARADIPWAFDPKCEADFVVLEGAQGAVSEPAAQVDLKAKYSSLGFIFGLVFLIAGVVFALPSCGLTLILSAVGGLIAFSSMRKGLAERLLGEVELNGVPTIATPGQKIPIQVSFTPKSNVKLNLIRVSLKGREQVVSGSGTNKTTHTHVLFEEKYELANQKELLSGKNHKFEFMIHVPATNSYSLDLSSNKIIWDTTVHIDIPKWPDWFHVQPFNLVQGKFESGKPPVSADRFSQARDIVPPVISQPNQAQPSAFANTMENDPVQNWATIENETNSYDQAPDSIAVPSIRTDLVQIVQTLLNTDRFSKDHEKIVENHASDFFEVDIEVERVGPTHGYFADDSYRHGKTISGILKGSIAKIQLQLPDTYNESLEGLRSDELWNGKGVIIKWDPLYERVEMLGI